MYVKARIVVEGHSGKHIHATEKNSNQPFYMFTWLQTCCHTGKVPYHLKYIFCCYLDTGYFDQSAFNVNTLLETGILNLMLLYNFKMMSYHRLEFGNVAEDKNRLARMMALCSNRLKHAWRSFGGIYLLFILPPNEYLNLYELFFSCKYLPISQDHSIAGKVQIVLSITTGKYTFLLPTSYQQYLNVSNEKYN